MTIRCNRSAAPIEHPAAYANAVKRNIIQNAQKTFERTYADAEAVLAFIDVGREYNDNNRVTYKEGFLGSLAQAYDSFGKLTEGQVNAVRKCIVQREERRAEWASKKAALNADRVHLGEVGKKITLTLTICHIVVLDTAFGTNFIYIMEDADKNVVIYKGKSDVISWTPDGSVRHKGDTFTVIATVKEHGVRDGVKQTIIQRPKAAK
tara:strand:- start:19155 stop:19775 length:621 start_codon:yes stop_codon:yes gene_type:complete